MPPNLIGLSIEIWSAAAFLNTKTARLLRELRWLTPGLQPGPVLRLGGNSADASCFVEDGEALPPGCDYRITWEALQSYKTFARHTVRIESEPPLPKSTLFDCLGPRSHGLCLPGREEGASS